MRRSPPFPNWRQLELWPKSRKTRRPVDVRQILLPTGKAPDIGMPASHDECRRNGLGDVTPCPHFRCRYHLGLDTGVGPGSLIKLVWPGLAPWEHETCSLVVATRRRREVIEVAGLMNLSVGSIEAIERVALRKMRAALEGDSEDGSAKHYEGSDDGEEETPENDDDNEAW